MLRALTLVVLTGGSLLAQSPAPRYTIQDLGPLTGSVTGINIRGQIIGFEVQSADRVRSFRTASNAAINWATDDLGTLGGTIIRAYGINTSGQVVGDSTLSTGEVRGFRTAPNKSIQAATDNIGTFGGPQNLQTRALGINDRGQVTGSSGTAFITAPNSAINSATDALDMTLEGGSVPGAGLSINSRGHVVGSVNQAFGYLGAFVHTGRATFRVSGTAKYSWEDYTGITDQDQFVFNRGNTLQMWHNGKTTSLVTCATLCVPFEVNNSLQVVGVTQANPFLYMGGVLLDLTTLIQNTSGWTMPNGQSPRYYINDLGQIAGVARLNNETHAFRLDPVPSAASAIQRTLNTVRSLSLDRRTRTTLPLMLKVALASKLDSALDAWNSGNPAATRGFMNEFENIVRAHAGKSLSQEQADRLLEMAEAAIAMT